MASAKSCSVVARVCPISTAILTVSGAAADSIRSTSSSAESRRIHSPLIQSSFLWSKIAAECVTRSRSNSGDELVALEDLLLVARPPPQQGEVVQHRLREVAALAELLHRHRAVALRQLGPVGRQDQRQVGVDGVGLGRAEGMRRRARTRCVVSMRSSPRMTWVMPISRSSTALARKKRGEPSERTITKSGIVLHSAGDLAPDGVGERARAGVGRAEAERHLAPLGPERLPLVGAEVTAVAVVPRRPALGPGGVAPRLDLVGGAEALVGPVLGEEAGRRRRGTGRSGCSGARSRRPSRARASAGSPRCP